MPRPTGDRYTVAELEAYVLQIHGLGRQLQNVVDQANALGRKAIWIGLKDSRERGFERLTAWVQECNRAVFATPQK